MADEPELELSPPYESMAALFEDVERNLDKLLAAYRAEGLAPTCRKGCDACCHQLVMTTVAEARAAARALQELPPATARGLHERLQSWLEATCDLRARLQQMADEDLETLVDQLAADYWLRRVPCPFLSQGACAIYAARPLICRHHFSLSDPEGCQAGEGDVVERMELMDDAFFFSQEAIPAELDEIGMFPELVELELQAAEQAD